MSFLDGFLSLGKNTNKFAGEQRDERQEGVVGVPLGELSLDKSDEELIELKIDWEKKWEDSKLREDIEAKQKENERYWLGEHYTKNQKKTGQREPVDNIVFEALETFLPVVSRQIAQPLIDTSPQFAEFAKKVEDKIVDVSDSLRLRLKVKKAIRNWSLYFLGVIKLGWNLEKDEIDVEAVRPQKLILDPDSITDECEYFGEYIGHYREDKASDLILRFPKKKKEILGALGKKKLGTKIRYIEWWTNDFIFWSLGSEVLDKAKNPHWNYEEQQPAPTGELDEMGEPIIDMQSIPGNNHFETRKMPFAFLSIFNLGKGPYDSTNLVEQVLSLQDIVDKRVRQIDKNADNANGGIAVSGEVFTHEQARGVGIARRRGETIRVPTGDLSRVIKQFDNVSLPNYVYQDLVDTRNRVLGLFGVTGLSSQGIQSENTVRGKILIRGQDADRASLIVDHIEQFYDYVFNWFVQLMMVYYDEPKPVTRSSGDDTISSADFIAPLIVSVKEGSLIPKDRLTQRNEAVELWSAGALDPLTLAERLEVPDPKEFVRRLILWKANPIALLQNQLQLGQLQATQAGQAGESGVPQPQTGTEEAVSRASINQVPIQ